MISVITFQYLRCVSLLQSTILVNVPKSHLSNENISAVTHDLVEHSWRTLVGNENANIAYDTFFDDFTKIYNKHCPVPTVQPIVSQTSLKNMVYERNKQSMHVSRKFTCIKHFYHPDQLPQKPDMNLIEIN